MTLGKKRKPKFFVAKVVFRSDDRCFYDSSTTRLLIQAQDHAEALVKSKEHFADISMILVGDILILQNCKNGKRISYQYRYPRGSSDLERASKGEGWGYWACCDNHFDLTYVQNIERSLIEEEVDA